MERFFYESKPFLCMLLAAYALLQPEPSSFLITCSIVLIACGAWILRQRMKTRARGSAVETMFYEAQPFFYIALGGYAFVTQRSNKFALACSLILFFCASVILKWRLQNRK